VTPGLAYALPDGLPARTLAFYTGTASPELRDNLLVGTEGGILRLRLDRADPGRVAVAERLLSDVAGTVRALAIGPDGAVYFCLDGVLARLRPDTR
jgi:glucose/arabinose dehydrogenase